MINQLEVLRYKYLAFLVVRDSISFYYGIPKFFETFDMEKSVDAKVREKFSNEDHTPKQKTRYRKLISKSIEKRVNYLKEDYEHCKQTLFEDNIWLQLLDIDPNFFKTYLNKLPPNLQNELAVVPKLSVRDDSLPRPYLINSDRNVKDLRF